MIVVTDEKIAGMRVVRTLGLVRGNTIRARHLGKDLMAVMSYWESDGKLAPTTLPDQAVMLA